MLSRLPIYLAQLKPGNNSEKLKNEIRQLLYSLCKSKNLICAKNLDKNLQKFDLHYLKMETIFMNTGNSKASESQDLNWI